MISTIGIVGVDVKGKRQDKWVRGFIKPYLKGLTPTTVTDLLSCRLTERNSELLEVHFWWKDRPQRIQVVVKETSEVQEPTLSFKVIPDELRQELIELEMEDIAFEFHEAKLLVPSYESIKELL